MIDVVFRDYEWGRRLDEKLYTREILKGEFIQLNDEFWVVQEAFLDYADETGGFMTAYLRKPWDSERGDLGDRLDQG